METGTGKRRIPEVDFLRGTAVLMMILFHLVFDLDYFSLCEIDLNSGFWLVFGYLTAFLFVFIAGMSAWISRKRAESRLDKKGICMKFLKRGLFIFAIGLGITAVTWVFAPESPIVFGTLHLIGLSIMVAPLFFGFGTKNIYIGLAVVFAGILIHDISGSPLLTIIGIHAPGFSTLDYKPVIPWFGYFLAGMAASEYLYPEGLSRSFSEKIERYCPDFIRVTGRHSLAIYLVHQPVMIILLSICFGKMLLSV